MYSCKYTWIPLTTSKMKSISTIITMSLNIITHICVRVKIFYFSETLTNTYEHKLKVLQLNKNISIN